MNEKDLKELEDFVFKVSMEGFTYALKNYPPPNKGIFKPLFELPAIKAESYLEKLMEENNLEYS